MKKIDISALIIAKNEEEMLAGCLSSLSWCREVVLIDDGSTDKTREIAESYGAKVISFKHSSFSRLREEALKRASYPWVFYIDADERVTPTLAKEIAVNIETNSADAFRISRENVFFGKKLAWGGWQDDKVERVFRKTKLSGWHGKVHETAKYSGKLLDLDTRLLHLTHKDVVSGLIKTANWTPIEASELFLANTPKVTFLTLVRKGWMEFFRRAVVRKGYKDGITGLVEAVIQGINRVLVYIQVWELQQKPSIKEKYQKLEKDLLKKWQKD